MANLIETPIGTRPAIEHGGNLAHAAALFPDAPQPWLDLSTGINPHSYPHLKLPATAFTRLPEPMRLQRLQEVASTAYGTPSSNMIMPAPGTQILLPMLAGSIKPGRAMILGPTYAEHAKAAASCGHTVEEVSSFEALEAADLAVVVNPNNPDGRIVARSDLLDLAQSINHRRGLLVVDEAFMDVGPHEHSVTDAVRQGGLAVLRSFGKFHGLAGVRLGFCAGSPELVQMVANRLGPWAVSGPAIEYGIAALSDRAWRVAMRERLAHEARHLDTVLRSCGLTVYGGTDLFRFVRDPNAQSTFTALGRAGIFVRRFESRPNVLRIGLPPNVSDLDRIAEALSRRHPIRPMGY